MKNKIIIIILCIIFIVGLFAINGVLEKQEKNTKNENIKEDKMSVLEVTSNEFDPWMSPLCSRPWPSTPSWGT